MLEPNIPYTIDRSKKRKKSIAILISEERGVVIKVPHRTPEQYIYQLVQDRAPWIQEKWAGLQARVQQTQKRLWVTGERLLYLGQGYTLEISPIPAAKSACEIFGDTLFVRLKKQALVEKVVERWYRGQAELMLTARSQHFAEILGVRPRQIIVKQQKSRWGSCDRHNIIRYNWQIIKASSELLDYLVVHELAHIQEKNHSAAFWAVVASVMPDYLLRRRALKTLQRERDF